MVHIEAAIEKLKQRHHRLIVDYNPKQPRTTSGG